MTTPPSQVGRPSQAGIASHDSRQSLNTFNAGLAELARTNPDAAKNLKTLKFYYDFLQSTGHMRAARGAYQQAYQNALKRTNHAPSEAPPTVTALTPTPAITTNFYENLVTLADSAAGRLRAGQEMVSAPIKHLTRFMSVSTPLQAANDAHRPFLINGLDTEPVVSNDAGKRIRAAALKKMLNDNATPALLLLAITQIRAGSPVRKAMAWLMSSSADNTADKPPNNSATRNATNAESKNIGVQNALANANDDSSSSLSSLSDSDVLSGAASQLISPIIEEFSFLPKSIQKDIVKFLADGLVRNAAALLPLAEMTSRKLQDGLIFALVPGSTPPKKFHDVLTFHTLKEAFERHRDRLPPKVAEQIDCRFSAIAQHAAAKDGIYAYTSFDDAPITVDYHALGPSGDTKSVTYPNIKVLMTKVQLKLMPHIWNEQQMTMDSANEGVLAKELLDSSDITGLIKQMPDHEHAVAQALINELRIPQREETTEIPSSLEAPQEPLTLKNLASVLGDALNLSRAERQSLAKLVQFHELNAQSEHLAEAANRITEETDAVKSEIDHARRELKRIQLGDGSTTRDPTAEQALSDTIDNGLEKLTALAKPMPADSITIMRNLYHVADRVAETSATPLYDLKSFSSKEGKHPPLPLETLAQDLPPSHIDTLALSSTLEQVLVTAQQVMQAATKTARPFDADQFQQENPVFKKLKATTMAPVIKALEAQLTNIQKVSQGQTTFDDLPSLYLHGPPGTGKSYVLTQMAKATGLDVILFDKEQPFTLDRFKKRLQECTSNNPIVIVDEAGEYLGKGQDALNSDLRKVIDPDITIKGLDTSKITLWMTANEELTVPKLRSRTARVKMDEIQKEVKEDFALEKYDEIFDQYLPLKNFVFQSSLKADFKQKSDEFFSDTNDHRAIKNYAQEYASEQIRFFSKELRTTREVNASEMTDKLQRWNAHFDTPSVKGRLEEYKKIDYDAEEAKAYEPQNAMRHPSATVNRAHPDRPTINTRAPMYLPPPPTLKREVSRTISTGIRPSFSIEEEPDDMDSFDEGDDSYYDI